MNNLTYTTKLICDEKSKQALISTLEMERDSWNLCSELVFWHTGNYSIKEIHDICYYNVRKAIPNLKSKYVIRSEQSVLAVYKKSSSSNHNRENPYVKKKLMVRLGKGLCIIKGGFIKITTSNERVKCY